MLIQVKVPKEIGLRQKIIPWLDNDWKQYYFSHWYFALSIEMVNGVPKAIVKDAHYEADHHNDILLSKPYDIDDLLNK